MKANELMIGDWVTGKKWRENPFKLTRINDNGKYYYGITPDETQVGPFLFEELESIPLTVEILKKNGFEGNKPYYYIYKDNFCKVCVSFAPRIEIDGMDLGEPPIHISIKGALFDINMIISSIHELQHELRRCRKEIEL